MKKESTQLVEAVSTAPVAAPTPAPALNPLVAAALNADIDPDKLDKLLDVQQKFEAEEARKAYHKAISEFRKVAPIIGRDRHVQFSANGGNVDYRHSSLGYAMAQVNPLLGEYGLSPSWITEQEQGGLIRVTCVISHAAGHSEQTSLFANPDDKKGMNSMQRIKSTITYLERTTLFAILGLAEDADDDGRGAGGPDTAAPPASEFITFEQAARVRELVEASERSEEEFLAWCKADSFERILSRQYPRVMRTLGQAGKEAKNVNS